MSRLSLKEVRLAADDKRDDERQFTNDLLDEVEAAIETIGHEVASLRSEGHEGEAKGIEDALHPLREVLARGR